MALKKTEETKTCMRWMISRDLPMVLCCEEWSFDYPWNAKKFILCVRQRNCIGMVAEINTPHLYAKEALLEKALECELFLHPERSEEENKDEAEQTVKEICERANSVTGYMMYELYKNSLRVINFAVHPEFRRVGLGKAMIAKLIRKISEQGRQGITVEVRETNLRAQLFFQSQGFRATGVMREHYENPGEDGYIMCYALDDDGEDGGEGRNVKVLA